MKGNLPYSILLRLVILSSFLLASSCEKDKKWWTGWWTPGDTVDNVGYHPDQPLPFSHKLHAGDKQIPCQYCHSSARRSPVAGIPSMNTCMGCHKFARTEAEPIKQLTAMYEKKEPLVWTKVHDMPDFVKFTHKRHIQSGLDCAECHGDVKSMDTVSQAAPMQMGWCIDCHEQRGAPTACFTCHF